MPWPTLRGIRTAPLRPGKVAASTFVELVVTMFLLVLFASLAFPIFWSSAKATTSHSLDITAQRAKLTLATVLPRFSEQVRPPYWGNPDTVFQSSGSEWKAFYRNGDATDFLLLRKESESRLSLVTSDATVAIDNLPGLSVDWWIKDKRILGFTVHWQHHNEIQEFHAAWGSFIL